MKTAEERAREALAGLRFEDDDYDEEYRAQAMQNIISQIRLAEKQARGEQKEYLLYEQEGLNFIATCFGRHFSSEPGIHQKENMFEAYKKLQNLICRCEEAIRNQKDLKEK